jgi:hypothetical protein
VNVLHSAEDGFLNGTHCDFNFTEVEDREGIPLQMGGKKGHESGLNDIYLPVQLTDWLLVEVVLLLIG